MTKKSIIYCTNSLHLTRNKEQLTIDRDWSPRCLYCPAVLTSMAIYFYKADQPYGCFSNFSPHPVTIDGKQWPTVEHYYQAHKLLGTPDQGLMEVIRQVPTPEEAAAMGRDCARTIHVDWKSAKQKVMWRGVLTKFLSHQDIQTILLNTGNEWLVEDSPRDYYWGCGKDGTGQNHLGRMLMRVRSQIRQQLAQTQCNGID